MEQAKFEEIFPPVKEEVKVEKKKRVTRKKAVGEKKETVKKRLLRTKTGE